MCAIAAKIARIGVRTFATGAKIAATRSLTEAGGIASRTCAIGARTGATAWKIDVTGGKIGGTAAAE